MNTRGFAVRSAASRQRGFSLVEVLISIIILSFGMLGMVGMQAAALQSNREARLQSVAYGLAQELAEMMRGNKDVALLTTGNPYMFNGSSPLTPGTPTYCLTVGTGCASAPGIANQTIIGHAQMTEWLARVDSELPGVRLRVCADTTPFDGSGLPNWACIAPAAAGADDAPIPMFIKIGWTQASTNRAAPASELLVRTSDSGARPALVFPVTPGSTK
jgi:type IV pilus assembly protein PilV